MHIVMLAGDGNHLGGYVWYSSREIETVGDAITIYVYGMLSYNLPYFAMPLFHNRYAQHNITESIPSCRI